MSKKKNKHKQKLRIGRFYNVREGSEKGHPGRIFNIDYKEGEYDSIITGTTYKKDMIPIHSTDRCVKKSYLRPKPFRGTRNDYGDKEYIDMHFDNDAFIKANKVKTRLYTFGHHYKKKHKIK